MGFHKNLFLLPAIVNCFIDFLPFVISSSSRRHWTRRGEGNEGQDCEENNCQISQPPFAKGKQGGFAWFAGVAQIMKIRLQMQFFCVILRSEKSLGGLKNGAYYSAV
jgi:hypothetical protein